MTTNTIVTSSSNSSPNQAITVESDIKIKSYLDEKIKGYLKGYFEFVTTETSFRIVTSSSKPVQQHSALRILGEFEYIKTHHLEYDSKHQDAFSQLRNNKLFKTVLFQNIGERLFAICNEYNRKQLELSFFTRKLFSKMKQVDAAYRKIYKNKFDLLDKLLYDRITSFSTYLDLSTLAQVSHQENTRIKDAIVWKSGASIKFMEGLNKQHKAGVTTFYRIIFFDPKLAISLMQSGSRVELNHQTTSLRCIFFRYGYFIMLDEKSTALHCAIRVESSQLVQAILDSGRANLNSQDSEGRTPLNLAGYLSNSKRTRIVRMLIEYGADAAIRDKKDRTWDTQWITRKEENRYTGGLW